jgi:hypothetical protein
MFSLLCVLARRARNVIAVHMKYPPRSYKGDYVQMSIYYEELSMNKARKNVEIDRKNYPDLEKIL